jgi:hypothetical protein
LKNNIYKAFEKYFSPKHAIKLSTNLHSHVFIYIYIYILLTKKVKNNTYYYYFLGGKGHYFNLGLIIFSLPSTTTHLYIDPTKYQPSHSASLNYNSFRQKLSFHELRLLNLTNKSIRDIYVLFLAK